MADTVITQMQSKAPAEPLQGSDKVGLYQNGSNTSAPADLDTLKLYLTAGIEGGDAGRWADVVPIIRGGANRYRPPYGFSMSGSSADSTANVVSAFVVQRRSVITHLGVEVATGEADFCVVGIYDFDPITLLPTDLLFSEIIDLTAAGNKDVPVAMTVEPGMWLAHIFSDAVNMRSMSVNQSLLDDLYGRSSVGNSNQSAGLRMNYTYDGTLPATFVSGGVLTSGGSVPSICMKYA